MELEVATLLLHGKPAKRVPRRLLKTAEPHLRWEDRQRRRLRVEPVTRLVDAHRAALRSCGLRVKPEDLRSGFVFDGSDLGEPFFKLDAVLAPDGSVTWYFDPDEVTFSDLERARQEDVFRGNPHRLYVLLDEPEPGGGNGLDYWLELLRNLPYLEAFLTIHGTPSAATDTVRGFSKVIRSLRNHWLTAGGDLGRYEQLFRLPRTTEQVAKHMAMRAVDVPAMMRFLGFAQGTDGYWRPLTTPEGKELRQLVAVVDAMSHWALSTGTRQRVFNEILMLPAEDRVKRADDVIRRVNYETTNRGIDDRFHLTAVEGRNDQFELLDFDPRTYRPIRAGLIQAEEDGSYSVLTGDGRRLLDRDGQPLSFKGIDDAAEHIGTLY